MDRAGRTTARLGLADRLRCDRVVPGPRSRDGCVGSNLSPGRQGRRSLGGRPTPAAGPAPRRPLGRYGLAGLQFAGRAVDHGVLRAVRPMRGNVGRHSPGNQQLALASVYVRLYDDACLYRGADYVPGWHSHPGLKRPTGYARYSRHLDCDCRRRIPAASRMATAGQSPRCLRFVPKLPLEWSVTFAAARHDLAKLCQRQSTAARRPRQVRAGPSRHVAFAPECDAWPRRNATRSTIRQRRSSPLCNVSRSGADYWPGTRSTNAIYRGDARLIHTACGSAKSCCSKRRSPPSANTSSDSHASFPTFSDWQPRTKPKFSESGRASAITVERGSSTAAAQRIVADYDGQFPTDTNELQKLPGIGRYTAGAIASIAFDQRAPILEANTIRLLSRLVAFRGNPHSQAGQRPLWRLAEELLPKKNVAEFNQALMEVGSLVCTPTDPDCSACPLSLSCISRAEGLQHQIPPAKPQTIYADVHEAAVIVRKNGSVLVRQCAVGERWAGLWDFPRFAVESQGPLFARGTCAKSPIANRRHLRAGYAGENDQARRHPLPHHARLLPRRVSLWPCAVFESFTGSLVAGC